MNNPETLIKDLINLPEQALGVAAEAHRNNFSAAGMTLDKKPGAEAALNALRVF